MVINIRTLTTSRVIILIFQVKMKMAAKREIITNGKNSNTRSAVDEANPISKGVPSNSLNKYALKGSPPAAPGVTLFPKRLAKSMISIVLNLGALSTTLRIIFHLKVQIRTIKASKMKFKNKN